MSRVRIHPKNPDIVYAAVFGHPYGKSAERGVYRSKDDPNLVLLSFDLIDASLWASTRNPVKFAWEIEHAKDSIKEPDVGAQVDVKF